MKIKYLLSIKHFVSKEAFNIDGFGKKIVENFWSLQLIRYPQDIFNLDYKKISNLEGWGKLSASNLKYSIEKKKHSKQNKSFNKASAALNINPEIKKIIEDNGIYPL